MGKKVDVAVFDRDNIVEWKEYKLNESGTKISIVPEGAGYFMPEIDNDSALYFPRFKKYFFFGERSYKKVYFVNNKAKKCFNFKTGEISLPDPEVVKSAVGVALAGRIGQDVNKGTPWYVWFLVAINTLAFFLLLNLGGFIR